MLLNYFTYENFTYIYKCLAGLSYIWQIMMIIFLSQSTQLLFWLKAYQDSPVLPAQKKMTYIKSFIHRYQEYVLIGLLVTIPCFLNSYLFLFGNDIFGLVKHTFYLTISGYQLLVYSLYLLTITSIGGLIITHMHE